MTIRRGTRTSAAAAGAGSGKRSPTRRAPRFPFAQLRPRWAIAALLLAAACGGGGAGQTAFVGAQLFDGTGAPPILDAVVIVANGRIEAVGPPDLVSVPRGALEVRLDGKWIIPGLIDAHAHSEAWMMSRFLAYGVTTVRDAGGAQPGIYQLRDSVSLRTIAGPNLYVSGAVIDGLGSNRREAVEVRSAREARRAIDELVLANAHQAKIFSKITRTLLTPLMDEAATLNTPVMAHLGRVDAITAARLGVRSLEHMTGVVEATVPDPSRLFRAHDEYYEGWNLVGRVWGDLDSASLDRTARRLVAAGTAIVPTLALHEAYSRLDDRRYAGARDLTGVPDDMQRDWNIGGLIRRAGLSPGVLAALRRGRRGQDRFVRLFARAGGLVGVGTDTPHPLLAPGASIHDELALLVAAGLTPEQALLAATRENARLLAADSIGVIKPGALADFVVVNGDPLQDIANTRAIHMVISRGAIFRPADLKQVW